MRRCNHYVKLTKMSQKKCSRMTVYTVYEIYICGRKCSLLKRYLDDKMKNYASSIDYEVLSDTFRVL